MSTVPLSDLTFDEQEEQAVLAVLRSRWLSSGEITQTFEREFAAFVGSRHAVAVTNCTAALHLALLAAGIGPGDEVLVPSLTFVATVNAIRYTGATPVFVDLVSEREWLLSPRDARAKVNSRTRAIVPMHYAGFPCDMAAIGDLARANGMRIVEDAAHGPGSWQGDRQIGTFGDAGCFSFFANKNLATGEGGMLVTDDETLAAKARNLRSHGMTTMSWERHRGHAYQYDVVALGYNYRLDEMRAAIGRVQLSKLPRNNEARERVHALYLEHLRDMPKIEIPFAGRAERVSHHLFPVLLAKEVDRATLMRQLRELGVQTSVHYPPAHLMEIHRDLTSAPLPITEAVASRELTLPMYPGMGGQEVEHVAAALRSCLRGAV